MTLHQDTVFFTTTERSLMAQSIRRDAAVMETKARALPVSHRQNLIDAELRAVRLAEAATLRELADDVEWGHRR